MCRSHFAAKEMGIEDGNVIGRILENADRFLSSNKGGQFVSAAASVYEGFMASRPAPQTRQIIICPRCGHKAYAGAPCGACITIARHRARRSAGGQQQVPPAAAPPAEDPRKVLGFEPQVALTRTIIKERQRALAIIMHPDQGGSDAAMQRINEAAAALLANLP